MTIDEALDRLLEFAGSDLLLSCGSKARIRKDGNLELLEGEDSKVLQPSDTQRMMRDVLDVKQWREALRKSHAGILFSCGGEKPHPAHSSFPRHLMTDAL